MTKARWLSADEQRAWLAYRRMRTLLDLQISRDLADDSGLSDSDYDVLSTLTERRDRQWRASDLAARLLWSTSRLAHHVGRMEGRGLVERRAATDDGRGAMVTLTDLGWASVREAAPHHVASVRNNFIDLLTPAEVDTLGDLCEKVIAHLAPPGAGRAGAYLFGGSERA